MTPDPTTIAAWVVCLVAVVAGINQVMKLLDRFKESPAPGSTYATKTELAGLRADVNAIAFDVTALRAELTKSRQELDSTNEARASRIHQRIDALKDDLNDKLQALPAQFIAVLKNTGAID